MFDVTQAANQFNDTTDLLLQTNMNFPRALQLKGRLNVNTGVSPGGAGTPNAGSQGEGSVAAPKPAPKRTVARKKTLGKTKADFQHKPSQE